MIEFIPNYIEYSDKRGSFLGLINFGNWKEINIICSEADTVRGDHYHKRKEDPGHLLVKTPLGLR